MSVAGLDTHAHIFHAGMPLSPDAWHRPAGEAPIELYLDNLRAAGIDRAVLAAASLFEDNNDYALTATAAHPNLRTTVIVDPATDDYALREMASAGAVGVRLQWRSTPSPPDLADPVWQRFLRRLANGGWHVQLHDRGDRLPAAIAAIERSGVPLVIDHFGRPDVTLGVNCTGFQAVLGAVERGRCWVKLSADFRIGSDALVRQLTDALLRHAGTDRLFWGSDWPFVAFEAGMTYGRAISRFETLVPDPAVRDAIHRTAGRFYFGDQ